MGNSTSSEPVQKRNSIRKKLSFRKSTRPQSTDLNADTAAAAENEENGDQKVTDVEKHEDKNGNISDVKEGESIEEKTPEVESSSNDKCSYQFLPEVLLVYIFSFLKISEKCVVARYVCGPVC